jgi:cytochrome P450
VSAVLQLPTQALDRPIVDAAFLNDPYPVYRAMREAGPIHWSNEFFGGAWLLTSHADVESVLRDPSRFAAQRTGGWITATEETRGELAGLQQVFARAMLFLDGHHHSQIRRVLNAGFRLEILQRLVPHIELIVSGLLDNVAHLSRFDFMQAVAQPLPVRVMTRFMGIEAAVHDDVMVWSGALAEFIGAPLPNRSIARRAQASLLAMTRYFETLLPEKRLNPGDDLLSRLVQAEAAGEIEAGAELLAQCAMLLFAGHETTRNLLGNGMLALLSHPEQWQRLQREPELIPGAVRELLRFDSPVQYTGRRVTTDLLLHGHRLRRGDLVVPLIGAANRDPARYPEPDTFDISRCNGSSLSFGSGPHVCIGAALTRLETEACLRQMVRRYPELQLADFAPRWNGNPVYRGLAALPLRRGFGNTPPA